MYRVVVAVALVVLVVRCDDTPARTVFVDSATGVDELQCGSSWNDACRSLSWVAGNLSLVDGDTIRMAEGRYSAEALSFPRVSIIGASRALTIIECSLRDEVGALVFRSGGLLGGVRIEHCRASAVISTHGAFVLQGCYFFNCTATIIPTSGAESYGIGGAVRVENSGGNTISMIDTVFERCGASARAIDRSIGLWGGAVCVDAPTRLVVHNCTFLDCFLIGLPDESGCFRVQTGGTLISSGAGSTDLYNITAINTYNRGEGFSHVNIGCGSIKGSTFLNSTGATSIRGNFDIVDSSFIGHHSTAPVLNSIVDAFRSVQNCVFEDVQRAVFHSFWPITYTATRFTNVTSVSSETSHLYFYTCVFQNVSSIAATNLAFDNCTIEDVPYIGGSTSVIGSRIFSTFTPLKFDGNLVLHSSTVLSTTYLQTNQHHPINISVVDCKIIGPSLQLVTTASAEIRRSEFRDISASKEGWPTFSAGSQLIIESCSFHNITVGYSIPGHNYVYSLFQSPLVIALNVSLHDSQFYPQTTFFRGDQLELTQVSLENCSAGMALVQATGTVLLNHCSFKNCTAMTSKPVENQVERGLIWGTDAVLCNSSEFDSCSTRLPDAGALASFQSVIAINSTFIRCTSLEKGGAIYSGDQATIIDSTFSHCTASKAGGAVFAESQASISQSSFDHCSAPIAAAVSSKILRVESSTFISNSASRSGVVHVHQNGSISDCEFEYNVALGFRGSAMAAPSEWREWTFANCSIISSQDSTDLIDASIAFGGASCSIDQSQFLQNMPVIAGARGPSNYSTVAGSANVQVCALDYCGSPLTSIAPENCSLSLSIKGLGSNRYCLYPLSTSGDGGCEFVGSVPELTKAGSYHASLFLNSVPAPSTQDFEFNVVPAAANATMSRSFGDGLKGGVLVNAPLVVISFSIQAIDAFGNNLTRGGDDFTASVVGSEGIIELPTNITDLGTGEYVCSYVARKGQGGSYVVSVFLRGELVTASDAFIEDRTGNSTLIVFAQPQSASSSPSSLTAACSFDDPCSLARAFDVASAQGYARVLLITSSTTASGGELLQTPTPFRQRDIAGIQTTLFNVTIEPSSPSAPRAIFDCGHDQGIAFRSNSFVTLREIDFLNCGEPDQSDFGAIRIESHSAVVIEDCSFTHNSARSCAAISSFTTEVKIIDSRFEENTASTIGAAICIQSQSGSSNSWQETIQSTIEIERCKFINNSIVTSTNSGEKEDGRGAALFISTTQSIGLAISDSQFVDNRIHNLAASESAQGAALYVEQQAESTSTSQISVIKSELHLNRIDSNTAEALGGAMFIRASRAEVSIDRCSITHNSIMSRQTRSIGGAVCCMDVGSLRISNSNLTSNGVIGSNFRVAGGGAVAMLSSLSQSNNRRNSVRSSNSAQSSNFQVSDSRFFNNSAACRDTEIVESMCLGGSMYLSQTDSQLERVTFDSSSVINQGIASALGGAAMIESNTHWWSEIDITRCKVLSSGASKASGGAVHASLISSFTLDQDSRCSSCSAVSSSTSPSTSTSNTNQEAHGGCLDLEFDISHSLDGNRLLIDRSQFIGNHVEGGVRASGGALRISSTGASSSSIISSSAPNQFEISHSEFESNMVTGGAGAAGSAINVPLSVASLHGGAASIDIPSSSSWMIHNVTFHNNQVRGANSLTSAGGALLMEMSQSSSSSSSKSRVSISSSRMISNSVIGGDASLTSKRKGSITAHGGHGYGGAIALTEEDDTLDQWSIGNAFSIADSEIISNVAQGGRGSDSHNLNPEGFDQEIGGNGGNAFGGAVYSPTWSISPSIARCTIQHNKALAGVAGSPHSAKNEAYSLGGAIYSFRVSLQDSELEFNLASVSNHSDASSPSSPSSAASQTIVSGGAVYSLIDFESTNCTMISNIVEGDRATGGAVSSFRSCSISATRLEHNQARGLNVAAGGAVAIARQQDQVARLHQVTMRNNSASLPLSRDSSASVATPSTGGAIFLNSTTGIRIESSSFTENSADFGGALFLSDLSTESVIDSSPMEHNVARVTGGAVFIDSDSSDVNHFIQDPSLVQHNEAAYGSNVAAVLKQMELVKGDSASLLEIQALWPGRLFNIAARLVDYANNTVARKDLVATVLAVDLAGAVYDSGQSENSTLLSDDSNLFEFRRVKLTLSRDHLSIALPISISLEVGLTPSIPSVGSAPLSVSLLPCPPPYYLAQTECQMCQVAEYSLVSVPSTPLADAQPCKPCPVGSDLPCVKINEQDTGFSVSRGLWLSPGLVDPTDLIPCYTAKSCLQAECTRSFEVSNRTWSVRCRPILSSLDGNSSSSTDGAQVWDPESQCSLGYTDRLCSRCFHNETMCFFRLGKECINIEEGPSWFREIMLVTATLLAMVCWNSSVGSGEFSTKKTLSFFVQMTALLNNQVFSRAVSDMFGFFGVVSGGSAASPPLQPPTTLPQSYYHSNPKLFGIRSAECLMPFLQSPVADFLLSMLYPVMLLLPLVILVTAAREAVSIWREARRRNISLREAFTDPEISASVRRRKSSSSLMSDDDGDQTRSMRIFGGDLSINSNDDTERLVDAADDEQQPHHTTWLRRLPFAASCFEAGLFILYSMLAFLTAKILEVFTCSPSIFEDPDNSFMSSIPWLQCSMTHSPEWRQLVGAAVAFGALYIVGIPVLFILLLIRSRRVMSSSDKEAKQSHYLRFFVAGLNSHYFWFEVRRELTNGSDAVMNNN